MSKDSKKDSVWEFSKESQPLVEPGEWLGRIIGWKPTFAFGRCGVSFDVELLAGPLLYFSPLWISAKKGPPKGYQHPEGVHLEAHFNHWGTGKGAKSKYRRALVSVFDGNLPDDCSPDCLVDQDVRCAVRTVIHDSRKNPLHPSLHYSIIETFLGPGEILERAFEVVSF